MVLRSIWRSCARFDQRVRGRNKTGRPEFQKAERADSGANSNRQQELKAATLTLIQESSMTRSVYRKGEQGLICKPIHVPYPGRNSHRLIQSPGSAAQSSSSPSTIHDDGDYQPLATNNISVCLLGITVPRWTHPQGRFCACKGASLSSWRLMAACCMCGLYCPERYCSWCNRPRLSRQQITIDAS